jgi:penicillin-binding protein 1B
MSDKKAPAKNKTLKAQAKSKTQSESQSSQQTDTQPVTNTGLKWCLKTAVKLLVLLLFTLMLSVIYLDSKVRHTFEGQRWQVPVQVFGQIQTLVLGQSYQLADLTKVLGLSGYQKVSIANQIGQFEQSSQRITFYRRPFNFGYGRQPANKITIEVADGHIVSLFLAQMPVSKVKIEPILIDRILPDSKEDRVLVALETVPETLLDTLLLVEDRNFYFHHGVSPTGIIRALVENIRAGRTVQGGSTLTQQLVKNMFLSRERSIARKVTEALMALILEYRYSKDQLLEAYINEVYLGQHYANGIYGFGLASKFYFGKNIGQLSPQQMALLIGQVKGPSYYDPWRYPQRAKERRNLVLRLMFEQHYLSRIDFEQAVESPLSVRASRRLAKNKYPAYLQLVKSELSKKISNVDQQSGIRVFTGFSHLSQQLLENTAAQQIALLEEKHQQAELEVAMIVTDINSGEIRALVGGKEQGYAGFNRALYAKRPIGSLIKPAIYLSALERYEHYNFATVLADNPITLSSDVGKKWQPKNYNGEYQGQVPLIDGLVHSLNVPTVNLGMSLGLDNIAKAMHLLGYPQDVVTRPSMLLGAIDMSPLEINQLYLPIAAQGYFKTQHAITQVLSGQGDILWSINKTAEQRMSSNAAYLLDYALSQVTKTGTARSLTWRLADKQLAGKTGTSNDLRDSWFIGYDQRHLVTTWVGRDDNKPTKLTGSSGALVLFADFMKNQKVSNKEPIIPTGISMTLFEQDSGHAVTNNCSQTIEYPAVVAGISITDNCIKERERSWLERFFGD